MTNDTTTPARFTVCMHSRLEHELDEQFSVVEGTNIEDLYRQLPGLHPGQPDTGRRRRLPLRPRVFRGRFAMCNTGFTYVQVGDRLNVIEFWRDVEFFAKRRHREVDVVIGQ